MYIPRPGFVGRGIVRERELPRLVWESGHVASGRGDDAGGADWRDVVALAVVVPGADSELVCLRAQLGGRCIHDLHKLGEEVENLLPTVVPERVGAPEPVLGVDREVGVEVRRYAHHVGAPRKRVEVGYVRLVGFACGPSSPCIPRDWEF